MRTVLSYRRLLRFYEIVYNMAMNMRQLKFLLPILMLTLAAAPFYGCTSVEHIDCGYDSFCSTASGDTITPTVIARSKTTLSCDFHRIIAARPVIKVTGPVKAKIKYRTYSNAADAVESEFELPDLELHERTTDLMERITRITATHESKDVQNFRFLDIELLDDVDILRTWAIQTASSEASCSHRQARPSKP